MPHRLFYSMDNFMVKLEKTLHFLSGTRKPGSTYTCFAINVYLPHSIFLQYFRFPKYHFAKYCFTKYHFAKYRFLSFRFAKNPKPCDNNNEVSFVTNFTKVLVEYELLALFHRRGNKQAAKEKQYVPILYLNPGKHTILMKQQMTFLESS